MKRILVILVLLFSVRSADALDTTIRVLGVYPSGTAIGMGYMQSQLSTLRQAWLNTGMPTSSGISIEIVNGETPIPVDLPGRPSTFQDLVTWANSQPGVVNARNAWAADVVILFSELMPDPTTRTCGTAQFAWINGNFVADPAAQGMDLRFRNQWYVAVVGQSCVPHAAAHEFGHLLGGGHEGSQANERLYPDSRAYSTISCRMIRGEPFCTQDTDVLGTPSECPRVGVDICRFNTRYSRNVPGEGDGAHQNARTFNQTAISVANYIAAPTAPEPILNPPINVHGFLIAACDQGWTRHQAHWSPDPRTNVPVTTYEIWGSQPDGSPLTFGWSVPVFQTFSDVFVIGADVRIFVKACTATRCSDLSVTNYLAQFVCGF